MSLQDELRREASWLHDHIGALCEKSADELDRLTAERDALKAELLKLRNHIVLHDDEGLALHSDLIVDADKALFWKAKQ